MHPFLRSGKQFLLMGLLWSPIALVVGIFHASLTASPVRTSLVLVFPPMVILLFVCLSIWYVCKISRPDKKHLVRFLLTHVASLILVNVFFVLVALFYSQFLDALSRSKEWTVLFTQSVPLFLGVGVSLYLISALVYYLVLVDERLRQAEHEALQQQVLSGQAELKALKITIHPHFLFNSLNILGPLIDKSPADARQFISHLADFLLYSLHYGKQPLVTVKEEVEHVGHYLGVEGFRLGERLKLSVDIDPASLPFSLQPFTLLPLVENAVKHGIGQCATGGTLSLVIKRLAGSLLVEVKNPVDPQASPLRGEGHGLENLRQRLALQYGPGARLAAHKDNTGFTVRLSIPGKQGDNR